jgi:putative sporulation protein YyaC
VVIQLNDLNDLLDRRKIPYFLCIGTSKSEFDNVAITIGNLLQLNGYDVLGTSDEQLHGKSINILNDEIISKLDKDIYQTIAIDISQGINNVPYTISDKPIKPGSGIGKNLPFLGDISIHINIEYFVPRFTTLFHMILQPMHPSYVVYTDKMVCSVFNMIKSALEFGEDKEDVRQNLTMRFADLILNKDMTVRQIANSFTVNKSTVHRYVSKLLPKYNKHLSEIVNNILKEHFATKYMKGGLSTRLKLKGVKRSAKIA